MWSIYCLFIARINKLVDAYIRARARISKAKMNENDENVDPMRDAAPDVEHLRLEISESGANNSFLFFCEQERVRETEGSFLFFQRGSLRDSSASGFPFRINDKMALGRFIVYWKFFDLEKARESSSDWVAQGILIRKSR